MPSLSLFLLFLQLWGNVQISLTQNVTCPKLPDVPHAYVSEETKQPEYKKGDVIHFTCEHGYISGLTIRYVCTAGGWDELRKGTCYLKPCELPDDTPNGYYQIIHGDDFVFGATIKYFCNEGCLYQVSGKFYHTDYCRFYMVSKEDTRTCLLDRWTNHVPICDPSSCDTPPADGQLTVKGLPQNGELILPNRFLTFSCDAPGTYLEGSSRLICGQDGNWDNPFPTCEDVSCKVEVINLHLNVDGLISANGTVKFGQKLRFNCNSPYQLDGSEEIECLQTGQWSASFPTCAEKCKVTGVPSNVRLLTDVPNNELKKGQSLRFECRQQGHFLRGNAEAECLANGEWSHPFPTCRVPRNCGTPPTLRNGNKKGNQYRQYRHNVKVEYYCQNPFALEGGPYKTCIDGEWTGEMRCVTPSGCGRPPPLQDGDTTGITRYRYSHNERVEYSCQNYYTMEGGPYKTCYNGEWTGEMTCLKPCTVDTEAMSRQNIAFRYTHKKKLYSVHDDEMEFMCVGYSRHDGTLDMRQKCLDGVIHLPTCISRF